MRVFIISAVLSSKTEATTKSLQATKTRAKIRNDGTVGEALVDVALADEFGYSPTEIVISSHTIGDGDQVHETGPVRAVSTGIVTRRNLPFVR
jgi:hypothetical protein